MEGKIVTGIEFTSLDGMMQWRLKFDDGSVGQLEDGKVSLSDQVGFFA